MVLLIHLVARDHHGLSLRLTFREKSVKNVDEKGYGAIGEHHNVWLVPRPEQPVL